MPTLMAKNLSFSYGQTGSHTASTAHGDIHRQKTLTSIDLTFRPATFYAILGPNGCGKTTFMDLLIGHLTPDEGDVLLDNASIFHLSRLDIAKQISLVAQNDSVNFPFAVHEVVMMGRHPHIKRFAQPTPHDRKRVQTVMEITGVDRFASRSILELSGGERQRVLFARALCQDTPFLFLDEAFSNMDIHHTIRLLDVVKNEVMDNHRTVISIFHDINLATIWADILIFMKKGRIMAHGPAESILNETLIESVFHVKSQVRHHPFANAKQIAFQSKCSQSNSVDCEVKG